MAYRLSSGDLDQRITIQNKTSSYDAAGGEVITWIPVSTVWAKVRDLSGREVVAAQSVQSESTKRVSIRYRNDITSSMRIINGPLILVITGKPRIVGKNEWLEIDCSEGMTNA